MKIVFFGLGSIGTRHAKILLENYKHDLYAFRSKKGSTKNSLGLKEFYSWAELDRIKPDVAFITNPTSFHIPTAILCAQRKMALFIEKPLGHDLNGSDQLLKIVKQNKVPTFVAYVLRFHPMIAYFQKAIKENTFLHMNVTTTSYLPLWRMAKNHLKDYSANKNLGGGVIGDLSHELDAVYYLLGNIKSIKGQYGRRGSVTVDTEDYADMLVATAKGPANIHIDFFSHVEQRIFQLDFKEKTLIGNFPQNTLHEYRKRKLVKTIQFKTGIKESYEQQINYFLNHLKTKRMTNDVWEAQTLFRGMIAFKKTQK